MQPERDLGHSPVIQVMFTLQNYPYKKLELPGLTISPVPFDAGITHYDLVVDVFQRDGLIEISFEYNADLFEAATIRPCRSISKGSWSG